MGLTRFQPLGLKEISFKFNRLATLMDGTASASSVSVLAVSGGIFGYDPNSPVTAPIDLGVLDGEVLAIVGPSGCGKTTVLKTIAGVLPLVGGSLLVDGAKQQRGWLSQNVSRTLQSFPLLHWLTVEDNLRLAGRVRGNHEVDVRQVLADFSALHLKDRYPLTLSGGERCRASLAQAALTRPRVLLLDEPFAGLDLKVKAEIAQFVFSFSRRLQGAVIFVTHDILDAVDYANRIAVMGDTGGRSRVVEIVKAGPGALERVRTHLLDGDLGGEE